MATCTTSSPLQAASRSIRWRVQSWRGNALQNDKELSNTVNKFGINAGAGFEMNLSRRLDLHIEGKYIFIDKFHQANLSIGLGYKF